MDTFNKKIKIEKYNNNYFSTNNIENNNKNYRNIISDRSRKSHLKLISEPNNIIINKNNDDIPSNETKRYFQIYSYRSVINKSPISNNKTYNTKNLFPELISKYKTSNTNINESNNNIMKSKAYNSPNSIRLISRIYKIHLNLNNIEYIKLKIRKKLVIIYIS